MKKQLTTAIIAGLFVSTSAFAQDQALSDTRGDVIKDRFEDCVMTLDGLTSCSPAVKTDVSLAADAFFDFNKATLKPAGKATLDQLVADLQKVKNVNSIALAGHTDSVGSDKYNQRLSERRAQAVADYLVAQGVSSSLVSTVGYGESQPVAPNNTAENRAKNRRVDVAITAGK